MIQGIGFDSGKFGYLKEGPRVNGKRTQEKVYKLWNDVFQRCYNSNSHKTKPTYAGCSVNSDWWDYQDFAKFYHEDIYRQEGWQLDKDLITKGNKEYGPATCAFIPRTINNFVLYSKERRGDCPKGVTYNKPYKKYNVQGNNEFGEKILNIYVDDPYEGFLIFKQFKEDTAKKMAQLYDGKVDPRVIKSLLSFEVDYE